MTEAEKMIAEGFTIAARDLESHKAAIQRLQENQESQHKKLLEFAEVLDEHAKLLVSIQEVWTKNFSEMGALLNQQTKVLEAMRALVLPDERVN
jgi:hypothetical protein